MTAPDLPAPTRDAGGEPLLLGAPDAPGRLTRVTAAASAAVARFEATARGPYRPAAPGLHADALDGLDPCPEDGLPVDTVLEQVGELVLGHSVRPHHPRCAAHLHSPTLLTAAAAEVVVGATNQSLDSFDQAPAATLVEDRLVRWLAGQLGLPTGASGVFTAGGTASNLLGLYLARERHRPGTAHRGLPPDAADWRILCSQAAHFSVQQAAAVLGLGRKAVVAVPTDERDRLDLAAFDHTVADLPDGSRVLAVVGTAGTTDAGAVDPLDGLADRAAQLGAWFHVDAAVGGAFCLSPRLAPLLAGVGRADSVTMDLHKLLWQPLGASVLLVRAEGSFAAARSPSDYLDRPDDDGADRADGIVNLVGRSLDTSRRFDALKVLISLRSTGRRQLAHMLEHVVDTTHAAADTVRRHPELELLRPPSTVMVLFRWRPAVPTRGTTTALPAGPGLSAGALDRITTRIQRELFASGRAVIGRTRVGPIGPAGSPGSAGPAGCEALKLTVVNPGTTAADLAELLDLVATTGRQVAAEESAAAAEAPVPVASHLQP